MNPMGIASMIRNGSLKDRNCATRIRNSSTTESDKPNGEAVERIVHSLHHAAQIDADVAGKFLSVEQMLLICAETLPRSSPEGVT